MKPFWKSKTLWVNIAAAAFIIAEVLSEAEIGIPLEVQAIILAASNVVLRKVTREPIIFNLTEPEDLTPL
ncbi:MAG: hypothetical protein ACE5IJ_11285 [Thermoplasmata archaeon]